MPRQLFKKGVSGNPGGVPNPNKSKKKARLKVQEILEMLDFKPFEEMIKLYRAETTKTRQKVDILIDLCSYIAPKLKHVELSGDMENPFVINLSIDRKNKSHQATAQNNLLESTKELIGEIIDDDND